MKEFSHKVPSLKTEETEMWRNSTMIVVKCSERSRPFRQVQPKPLSEQPTAKVSSAPSSGSLRILATFCFCSRMASTLESSTPFLRCLIKWFSHTFRSVCFEPPLLLLIYFISMTSFLFVCFQFNLNWFYLSVWSIFYFNLYMYMWSPSTYKGFM